MSKKKYGVMKSKFAYNIIAGEYKKMYSYLDSFEEFQVVPIMGDIKGKKVLDVGAGTGRLTKKLVNRGALVTALDISDEMLKKNKVKNIQKVIGEAEALPFTDNSYDCVLATFLVVHLKDPLLFFREAYRVLKPGGMFVVTNINQKKPPVVETKEYSLLVESYYHRPESIVNKLEEALFIIEEDKFVKEGNVWVNQIIVASKK